MKIALSKPYVDKELEEQVKKVLDSGIFIGGEMIKEFEREFSKFCSVKSSCGVSSGTAAILLSLMAIGITSKDEVIVPSHSFIATASPVLFLGAKPVYADIDPETYTLDVEDLKKKVNKRTKAIIPVHLYGHPCEMDGILDIAEEKELFVIEDACQAHGATFEGKKTGSIGDFGCFSFYPSKNMTVCGDGGMITSSNEELIERVKMLRNHGRKEKYIHEMLGLNFRIGEIPSAIGRVQLRHLPDWIKMRRKVAALYNQMLEGAGVHTPVEKDWANHVYHLYVIRCSKRDSLAKWLKEAGVGTGIHYPVPIHQQPCMKNGHVTTLPVTEKYKEEILSLPMQPALAKSEVEFVVDRIQEFYRK